MPSRLTAVVLALLLSPPWYLLSRTSSLYPAAVTLPPPLLLPPSPPQGVLRGIYLSPGGAKGDSPLSRFHGVLFGLLGALPSSDDGSGRGKSAPALMDGVMVRDVPAFLQVRRFSSEARQAGKGWGDVGRVFPFHGRHGAMG